MKVVISVTLLLFYSVLTYAGQAHHNKKFTVNDSIENVVRHITDYENACQSGCEYYIPSVEKVKIIKDYKFSKDSFYIWTFVKSTLHSKYFSKVEIKRSKDQVTISQRQITKEEASALIEKTGLEHRPLLNTTFSSFDLKKNKDHVDVNYQIEVSYEGFILELASSKIKKGIIKSTDLIGKGLKSRFQTRELSSMQEL
jgi:carbon monoxide dehydrogenase subunit G